MAREKPPQKIRLDELLVKKGEAETRSQAKALILSGRVRLGTEVLDKPGKTLPEDAPVWLVQPPRFVGRGGEKLEAALAAFSIECQGLHVLDIGASTGGFTDCALQAGAASATCVDVGHSQLHSRLRDDPRVTNLEKTNARHLQTGDLPREDYDLVVIDVSFISLRLILPAVWPFLAPDGRLVALVKPQFEAEKKEVDRAGGVIKDPSIQERVLGEVQTFAREALPGAVEIGAIDSPIRGAEGNREFLLGLRKTQKSPG
jgi:23S rRNA (cytidine1920-2'-O)/16S rRNA (cytidine1409-2'-O)-methyltransferase